MASTFPRIVEPHHHFVNVDDEFGSFVKGLGAPTYTPETYAEQRAGPDAVREEPRDGAAGVVGQVLELPAEAHLEEKIPNRKARAIPTSSLSSVSLSLLLFRRG